MQKIKSKSIDLSINRKGAEIESLKFFGNELIWQKKPGFWQKSAPILFPFCGFLKDGFYTHEDEKYESTVHGFASVQTFKVVEQSESKICFSLTENEETLKQYPFKFELRIVYELIDTQLIIKIEVKNTNSAKTLPYSTGWHPGFKFSDGAYLKFDRSSFRRRNVLEGGLIGKYSDFNLKDNLLSLNHDTLNMGGVVLETPNSAISLVDPNYKVDFYFEEFPNLVLWGQPGAGFYCIEPWYGMGDLESHNNVFTEKADLISLKPSERKILSLSLKLSK